VGVPQFCSQDTSHVFIQLHYVVPLRTSSQNFRYISNTRSDSSVTFLATSYTNVCEWRNYHLAMCNNVHRLAVCSFCVPTFFTPCFLINISILHNKLRKFFNCNFMEESSREADSCSAGIRSTFFLLNPTILYQVNEITILAPILKPDMYEYILNLSFSFLSST
jgi:hypothetical protein